MKCWLSFTFAALVATTVLAQTGGTVGNDIVANTYFANGLQATKTDQRGVVHKYVYDSLGRLTEDDVNIVFHNRVNNLKKIYSYLPEKLNQVLMHFSMSAPIYYEETKELLEDLGEAREELKSV